VTGDRRRAGADQRDANDREQGAGHQRWEEPDHLRERRRQPSGGQDLIDVFWLLCHGVPFKPVGTGTKPMCRA
jgi:hypothetical protein